PGAGHAGTVELVDIGLGPHLPDEPDATAPQGDDIRALLPRPGAESDKYRRGVLGLLAGSDRYTGAVLLAAGGAGDGGGGRGAGAAWSGWSPRTWPPCWSGRPGRRPLSPCTPTIPPGIWPARPAGCRPGWPAPAWEPIRGRRPGWPPSCAPTCPCWWTPTG